MEMIQIDFLVKNARIGLVNSFSDFPKPTIIILVKIKYKKYQSIIFKFQFN